MRMHRKKLRRLWLLFAQSVTVLLASFFVVSMMTSSNLFTRNISMQVVESNGSSPDNITSFSGAVENVMPSIVSVMGRNGSEEEKGHLIDGVENIGSGVIVSSDGYILTNNHVIGDAQEIEVVLYDGSRHAGWVIGQDDGTDLAVIKIDHQGLPVIVFGDDSTVRVGDVVIAFGNPFGLPHSVSMGVISAIGRNQLGLSRHEHYFQTDAAINPGSSGGALTNTRGELIGINSALYTKAQNVYAQGIGFAIPVEIAWSSFKRIVQDKGVNTRSRLGMELETLSESLENYLAEGRKGAMLVTKVDKHMLAGEIGVQTGDVLVSINGQSPGEFGLPGGAGLLEADAEEPLELIVFRDGEELTFTR